MIAFMYITTVTLVKNTHKETHFPITNSVILLVSSCRLHVYAFREEEAETRIDLDHHPYLAILNALGFKVAKKLGQDLVFGALAIEILRMPLDIVHPFQVVDGDDAIASLVHFVKGLHDDLASGIGHGGL